MHVWLPFYAGVFGLTYVLHANDHALACASRLANMDENSKLDIIFRATRTSRTPNNDLTQRSRKTHCFDSSQTAKWEQLYTVRLTWNIRAKLYTLIGSFCTMNMTSDMFHSLRCLTCSFSHFGTWSAWMHWYIYIHIICSEHALDVSTNTYTKVTHATTSIL